MCGRFTRMELIELYQLTMAAPSNLTQQYIFDLRVSGLRWHQGSIRRRSGIHFVNLRGEPQPTLRKIKMRELAIRIGHCIGRLEAFVCSRAKFAAADHQPG
jgi:hypothetical protein